ncbi:short-chain collagen C4-like, partial [Rhopilema esculentum]|uniref:short-chain collagen C4-like n=1 Tax=Rhopilema esculentum TaxID=499914 RepID=UPI0031D7B070
ISAGQHFTHTGGISNTLCLHPNPEYASYSDSIDTSQWIYNIEYKVSAFSPFEQPLHHHDAPCAVCLLETRGTKVMIPGRNICPSGWTMEYKGYLLSESYASKGRTAAVCVDEKAEPLPETSADSGGSLWYLVQGTKNPYISGQELTCVVCTR